jgi:predicted DNA-binding transcriptional regulator YafY
MVFTKHQRLLIRRYIHERTNLRRGEKSFAQSRINRTGSNNQQHSKEATMPKADKTSTLLRQWEMLRMLTVSRSDDRENGRWDKASEITTKLLEAGYPVQLRTVQRDLKELSSIFPIEVNDKNPRDYGWRWRKGHDLNIQGLGSSEALAMCMVEKQLKQQLPSSMLEALQGIFRLAQKTLDQLEKQNNQAPKSWLSKFRVVQPTQTLLAPTIQPQVQEQIYQALLEGSQLDARYTKAGSNEPKQYPLHPLAIIQRGTITYLIATAHDYTEPHLYALHRFDQAEKGLKPATIPADFDVDKFIAHGFTDFAIDDHPLQLTLRCKPGIANILRESPLSANQTITTDPDGKCTLNATVNNTNQLRWWLLSQGDGVEVCAPSELREEIKAELRQASQQYN